MSCGGYGCGSVQLRYCCRSPESRTSFLGRMTTLIRHQGLSHSIRVALQVIPNGIWCKGMLMSSDVGSMYAVDRQAPTPHGSTTPSTYIYATWPTDKLLPSALSTPAHILFETHFMTKYMTSKSTNIQISISHEQRLVRCHAQ